MSEEKQESSQGDEKNLKMAVDCFCFLASQVNECFICINLVASGERNSAVDKDMQKIRQLMAGKKRWRKAFYSIYIYYKKMCMLMNTLVVSDEDEFRNLESVCSHFGIPERIFMRELVNSDTSAMMPAVRKINRILKK